MLFTSFIEEHHGTFVVAVNFSKIARSLSSSTSPNRSKSEGPCPEEGNFPSPMWPAAGLSRRVTLTKDALKRAIEISGDEITIKNVGLRLVQSVQLLFKIINNVGLTLYNV